MNTYFIFSVFGLWLLYDIILFILYRKKVSYNFIVTFLFIGLYISAFYLIDYLVEYKPLIEVTVVGVFILTLFVQGILKNFKKDLNEEDFKIIENELKSVKKDSEFLRLRFISTIEIFSDGICFQEDNDMSFGTDKYIEIIGLKENYFSNNDFAKKMHKDDVLEYHKAIEKVSKKNAIYKTTYRIKKNENYIWIKEIGKVFDYDKKKTKISIIKRLDTKQFPETEIEVLNNLPGYSKMFVEMQRLNKEKIHYHFVIIQLSNVPIINQKYGRDFGDLMMGEYLSKLQYKFIKDSNCLFRIEGIKFGLIIKEKAKFDLLERALINNGDLVNIEMMFGGVRQAIYPNIGISESPYEEKNTEIVLQQAISALEMTLKKDFDSSYYFHR